MILIEVPSDKISFVSGKWEEYSISPRLMMNGNGAINPNVLTNIPTLPNDIRTILENCEQREIYDDDFPSEVEE